MGDNLGNFKSIKVFFILLKFEGNKGKKRNSFQFANFEENV